MQADSLRYHNSHVHHLRHQHNSVPNSPNETEMGHRTHHTKSGSNSANTSPISANRRDCIVSSAGDTLVSSTFSYNTNNFVRTSRSEDQLQMQKDAGISAVDIEIDDDINSSLNTLLDTRPEGSNNSVGSANSDRIVWTYNAPVTAPSLSNGSSSSSNSSSSPLRSGSPASPTSVSSSVMSSQSGSRRLPYTVSNGPQPPDYSHYHHPNGDFSMSEVISNISSPDYHDDDSMGIRDCVMEISDHSDSDSTLLVSEPRQRTGSVNDGDHRIVIQVKGPERDGGGGKERGKQSFKCNDRNNKSKQYYGYQVSFSFFVSFLRFGCYKFTRHF